MNEVIGECPRHPGRSMIDCPACAIEGMKKESIQRPEILYPPHDSMCKSHKSKRLNYNQRVEWAEKQVQLGLDQDQCPKCKRWFFPSEF